MSGHRQTKLKFLQSTPSLPRLPLSAFICIWFTLLLHACQHLYAQTHLFSDSFWIYRRYINKSIYLSIYLSMHVVPATYSNAFLMQRLSVAVQHDTFLLLQGWLHRFPRLFTNTSGLIHFYFVVFFHFLVVVVDWADLYQLLSVR